MASVITQAWDGIQYLYNWYLWTFTLADKRVENWLWMNSPWPTVTLVVMYLVIVRYGPRMMKNRKPYSLKGVLVVYNFFVMSLNAFIAFELLYCGLKSNYNWFCQLVDRSMDHYEYRIAKALWWYYFSKWIELMDTFFFILRKKNNQLTFLHVYHHSTMFLFWWVGAKWVPGGSSCPGAMVNSFVHILMYFYYALAALGPEVQKYLWWKKHLTIIQLIQFTIGVVLGVNAILTGCAFTRWMLYAFVLYASSFIVLFANFYIHAYGLKNKKKLQQEAITSTAKENGYVVTSEKMNGTVSNLYPTEQKNGYVKCLKAD